MSRWLFQLNSLHMELAVTARKEKNYNLSRLCLEKAFGAEKFRNYVEKFRFGSTCLSVDKASCLRQSAKLLRVQGDGELGVRILCGIAINVVTSMNFHNQNNFELLELSSRLVLLYNILIFNCKTKPYFQRSANIIIPSAHINRFDFVRTFYF